MPAPRARRAAFAPPPDIPAESSLLLGLLGDALRAPLHLVLVLLHHAGLRRDPGLAARTADLVVRPASRLWRFATAAQVTASLILLNLLGFAAELWVCVTGGSQRELIRRFAVVPADLVHGRVQPLLLHVFAHAGVGHLLGNMLTLLLFGRIVERHLGPTRTLLCYLGAATVSTALSLGAQVALGQSIPTLGASGAVAGIVALAILFEPFTLTFEALLPMPVLLLGWLALGADLGGIWSGRHDGIDHFAHVGGYLSVLLMYWILDPDERRQARLGLILNIMTVLGLGSAWWLWSL